MSVTVRQFFVGFEVRVAGIILIVAVRTCMMKKRLHRGSININYNANCVTFFTGKDDEAKNRFIALA